MSSIKKNLAYNISYQILSILLPLITAPYISRVLGAEGIGTYSYTYSIASYFMLFAMLGISNHGNRSIASTPKDKKALGVCFINNYMVQLKFGLIVLVMYGVYAIFISSNRVISLIQILVVLSGTLDINWFFWGLEKFKITVIRNTICKVISVACIFLFVHDQNDLWVYVIIMSLTMIISQLLLWKFLFREIKISRPRYCEIKKNIKPILVLFLPILAYSFYRVMDKIMLGNFSDMTQVGYYENAEKILNIPIGIVTALGNVMLPRISSMVAEGNKGGQERYIRNSFIFVSVIEGALCFGIAAVSPVFIPLYYGNSFETTSKILEILIFTALISGWANVIRTQYLIPMRKDNIYVVSMIVAAGVNFVLNIIFIARLGAMGALIGTVTAEIIVLLIQAISVRKIFDWRAIIKENVSYIVIGCVMFIGVRTINRIIMCSAIIKLIIDVVIGGWIFIILLIFYSFYRKNVIYDSIYSIKKKHVNGHKNNL